jgi:hypothetical protein
MICRMIQWNVSTCKNPCTLHWKFNARQKAPLLYIGNCIYVTVYLTSKENTQIILQKVDTVCNIHRVKLIWRWRHYSRIKLLMPCAMVLTRGDIPLDHSTNHLQNTWHFVSDLHWRGVSIQISSFRTFNTFRCTWLQRKTHKSFYNLLFCSHKKDILLPQHIIFFPQ